MFGFSDRILHYSLSALEETGGRLSDAVYLLHASKVIFSWLETVFYFFFYMFKTFEFLQLKKKILIGIHSLHIGFLFCLTLFALICFCDFVSFCFVVVFITLIHYVLICFCFCSALFWSCFYDFLYFLLFCFVLLWPAMLWFIFVFLWYCFALFLWFCFVFVFFGLLCFNLFFVCICFYLLCFNLSCFVLMLFAC